MKFLVDPPYASEPPLHGATRVERIYTVWSKGKIQDRTYQEWSLEVPDLEALLALMGDTSSGLLIYDDGDGPTIKIYDPYTE